MKIKQFTEKLSLKWRLMLKDCDFSKIEQHLTENPIYYPENIFKALTFFDPDKTNVVILGQDPYHTKGVADGLAFSVQKGQKYVPPSLRNIFIEIGGRDNPNLEDWAQQGVLLLNTILTVKPGKAKSHAGIGWQKITQKILKEVAEDSPNCVFILLGNDAKKYQRYIKWGNKNAYILTAGHPSPLNTSKFNKFKGSDVFKDANDILSIKKNITIKWK